MSGAGLIAKGLGPLERRQLAQLTHHLAMLPTPLFQSLSASPPCEMQCASMQVLKEKQEIITTPRNEDIKSGPWSNLRLQVEDDNVLIGCIPNAGHRALTCLVHDLRSYPQYVQFQLSCSFIGMTHVETLDVGMSSVLQIGPPLWP